MSLAVEANVRWSVQQIRDSPEGKLSTVQGDVKLVGAVYDIATGRVQFLE